MDTWFRAPDVAFECSDQDVYLLDLQDLSIPPEPRALQGPAASIWRALGTISAPRSEQDLLQLVAEEYGMKPGDIQGQVLAFLHELESAGLAITSSVADGNGARQ
ncbi:PqqD family protein [Paenarthrobacter sp. S56]|uniref:PqqD family protein n=1 Tax=Paenarthrobacter sp. S56 TaxID=3138179 RepID=UPI00321A739E